MLWKLLIKVVEAIHSKKYDSIILNFANPDMVGHTGNIEAAIKALEALDGCVERVVEAIEKANGNFFNYCRSWKL